MNEDYKIIEIIERKIKGTLGEEQKEWVRKYDIFTNRLLFKEYNKIDKLKEVESIKQDVLSNE